MANRESPPNSQASPVERPSLRACIPTKEACLDKQADVDARCFVLLSWIRAAPGPSDYSDLQCATLV